MEVAIIGGGIGGLTTALALRRLNIPFRLYEAAPELKAVGAGIVIANNAMQVFRSLGIAGQIAVQGNRLQAMSITRSNFSLLSRTDLGIFEQQYGLQNHAIHRASLHQILADAAGHEHIVLGKRFSSIKPAGNAYLLGFEDGSEVLAPYVIGADGIRSRVREQFFTENELRHSGQVCYRALALCSSVPVRFTGTSCWIVTCTTANLI
jgi:2-polyprenyl-6-methoxyphenol hydroxylase-like FAD-dependent oxidoreductase